MVSNGRVHDLGRCTGELQVQVAVNYSALTASGGVMIDRPCL